MNSEVSISAVLVWVSILLLGVCRVAAAGEVEREFFEANKLYASGYYEEAIKGYEGIAASGIEGGHIYYNLANAYFKSGDTGRAILNYERAYRLIPYDEDLRANMAYVQSTLEDPVHTEYQGWLARTRERFVSFLGARGWLIAVMVFYASIFVGALVAFCVPVTRQWMRVGMVLLAVGLVVSGTALGWVVRQERYHKGIITAEEVEIRYDPTYTGVVGFKLHEGTKVSIIRSEGDWCQIRIVPGKGGWVEQEKLEEI